MKLLLDTHAFIWTVLLPRRLSPDVLNAIQIAEVVLVSAGVAYEIEYKRWRDPELSALPSELDEAVRSQGFAWLPISAEQAAAAARLPPLHRDPWDRLYIAQAKAEGLTLVTRDAAIARYDVPILW